MPEQLTLGVDPLADVVAWREKNMEAFEVVETWAFQDHAAGIPISTRTYLAILRRPHFASLLGLRRMGNEPVLVNDRLSAGLARLLNRLHPELKVPTRERSSDHWKGAVT